MYLYNVKIHLFIVLRIKNLSGKVIYFIQNGLKINILSINSGSHYFRSQQPKSSSFFGHFQWSGVVADASSLAFKPLMMS